MDEPTPGYLLWRTTTQWRTAADRALAPLGLTHAQYTLLASLYGMGTRPSQRELADVAGLEPIYVSKLIRALERDGLVARTEHPGDPRAVQITVTDSGAATARRAIAAIGDLHGELLAPIGGPDGPRARELVRTLTTLLGRSDTMTTPMP